MKAPEEIPSSEIDPKGRVVGPETEADLFATGGRVLGSELCTASEEERSIAKNKPAT